MKKFAFLAGSQILFPTWTSPLAQGPVELIIPFPGKGIDKNMISFKLLLQPGNKQSQDISFQLGKNFPGLLV